MPRAAFERAGGYDERFSGWATRPRRHAPALARTRPAHGPAARRAQPRLVSRNRGVTGRPAASNDVPLVGGCRLDNSEAMSVVECGVPLGLPSNCDSNDRASDGEDPDPLSPFRSELNSEVPPMPADARDSNHVGGGRAHHGRYAHRIIQDRSELGALAGAVAPGAVVDGVATAAVCCSIARMRASTSLMPEISIPI